MQLTTKGLKHTECEIHGRPSMAANKTLLLMMFASMSLIIWHVWVYGTTTHAVNSESLQGPFPILLGSEIWDLLFNGHGIFAELWAILPYFIVGILLAGYIRTYKLAMKLQITLRRHGILSVFIAAFVGMI